MARLLVSVRDADEAADAVEAGADLIDVKEPRAGSLGAAAMETIAAIVGIVAGRRPISVAMGDLIGLSATGPGANHEVTLPPAIQFAKIGLAGCLGRDDWISRWQQALGRLPIGVSPVAVAYADWRRAESPSPQNVIEAGHRLGCRALLVDTFDKRGPGLLGVWSPNDLNQTVAAARAAGMLVVLGGQVREEQVPSLLSCSPDYIAVRGAVCRGDRAGRLDPQRVRRLKNALADRPLSPPSGVH